MTPTEYRRLLGKATPCPECGEERGSIPLDETPTLGSNTKKKMEPLKLHKRTLLQSCRKK